MIFRHLQAKLKQFLRLTVQLHTAQVTKFFFGSRSTENACLFAFQILRCCKNRKKAFAQADTALEIIQLYKYRHTIIINAFKI